MSYRRMAQDGVFYCTSTGLLNATNLDTGNPPAWLNQNPAVGSDVAAGVAVNTVAMGFSFKLSDVPSYQEFTNLYNEYRFDKVLVKITPTYHGEINGTASAMPTIYSAWDPNDASNPTSTAYLQQYDNCRVHDVKVEQDIWIKGVPRVAQQLYVSMTGTSYGYPSDNKLLWIDTATPSSSTPHYALKLFIRNMVLIAGSGTGFRIQPIYYFTCRRTR